MPKSHMMPPRLVEISHLLTRDFRVSVCSCLGPSPDRMGTILLLTLQELLVLVLAGVCLVTQRALQFLHHLAEPGCHLAEVGKRLLERVVVGVNSIFFVVVADKLVGIAVIST